MVSSTEPSSAQPGTRYTIDPNGAVTDQTPDTGAVGSWKGMYSILPGAILQAQASLLPPLALTYAAARGGNLAAVPVGSGASVVHHSIGLAWCGTGFGKTGSCGTELGSDMAFAYVANPMSDNISTAQDFSGAHPEWVGIIQAEGMKALKKAFAAFPVMVHVASYRIESGQPEADQEHVAYVVGGWPPTNETGQFANREASRVFYWTITQNAEIALGRPEIPSTGAGWIPFTPQSDSDFRVLMAAIGRGIGNTAAHEIGHQFNAPPIHYMDCGYDVNRAGGPLPCENNDNYVYNFFSGSGLPQDPSNPNSTGAQFKYVEVPGVPAVHWSPTAACDLKRNLVSNARCGS